MRFGLLVAGEVSSTVEIDLVRSAVVGESSHSLEF
jgi:hypothetical protein